MSDRLQDILSGLSQPDKKPEKEKPAKVEQPEPVMPVVVETPPVEQPPEPEKPTPPEVQQAGGRRWKYIYIGIATSVIGFAGIFTFASHQNMALGFLTVLMLVGGGGLVWWGNQKREEGIFISPTGKRNQGPANVLAIRENIVEFEQVDDPAKLLGYPHKCRNDGKYYWVHISGRAWGGETDDMVAFMPPDTHYHDPREFSNNLNIPAHRKLAERRSTLFEKISPALILVGYAIVFMLFIVM